MANRKKDIIKMIESMSGKYAPYDVFSDWIKMYALAISNACQLRHDKLWQEREEQFADVERKYTPEERTKFAQMCAMLVETTGERMGDILGEIYMEAGMGSKYTGQFFTPYHVSLMTAKLTLTDMQPDEKGYYHLNEPSCGGGGMIIAAAQALMEKGINYQRRMKVIAQDLDWKGVYMCYVQLSLYGIKAIVVQGDTLKEPYKTGYPEERVLRTPAERGLLL